MWRAKRDFQKEWTAGVVADERDGPLGQLVPQIPLVLNRGRVLPEIGLPIAAHVRVPVDVARQKTPEVVEAVSIGLELRLETQVPLADETRRIAGVLQELRQRAPRRRKADVEARRRRRRIGLDRTLEPHPLLVAARHEPSPRRRTHRRVGVEVGQPDPFAREPVEVRGLDIRRAVAAKIAIPEIVGHDEHDVRPSLGRSAPRHGGDSGGRGNDERGKQIATGHNRYRFTTVTMTLDGYCFEWWMTLCATTPFTSS